MINRRLSIAYPRSCHCFLFRFCLLRLSFLHLAAESWQLEASYIRHLRVILSFRDNTRFKWAPNAVVTLKSSLGTKHIEGCFGPWVNIDHFILMAESDILTLLLILPPTLLFWYHLRENLRALTFLQRILNLLVDTRRLVLDPLILINLHIDLLKLLLLLNFFEL